MNSRLLVPTTTLRIALGLMATLAGLDKFFNLLANWESYIAPVALQLSPVSPHVLMAVVGIVEFAVGLTILLLRPSIGCYIASVWLLLVAGNLIAGGHFDVAVRDVVISIAAFTAARLLEVQHAAVGHEGRRLNPALATGVRG
jgi:uncharacterized membrane protein YphA (DoxX/SURF4 family)